MGGSRPLTFDEEFRSLCEFVGGTPSAQRAVLGPPDDIEKDEHRAYVWFGSSRASFCWKCGFVDYLSVPKADAFGHAYQDSDNYYVLDGVRLGMTKAQAQELWGEPAPPRASYEDRAILTKGHADPVVPYLEFDDHDRVVAFGASLRREGSEFERLVRFGFYELKEAAASVGTLRDALESGVTETPTEIEQLDRAARERLDSVSRTALKAAELLDGGGGSVRIDDFDLTPEKILGGVACFQGDLLYAREDWHGAVAAYQEALTHDPDDVSFNYFLGCTYAKKHDTTEAITAFKKVVALDPTGRYGIESAGNLERLTSGSLGGRTFSGSWKVVAALGGAAALGLLTDSTGLFLLGGGALGFYWWLNLKLK